MVSEVDMLVEEATMDLKFSSRLSLDYPQPPVAIEGILTSVAKLPTDLSYLSFHTKDLGEQASFGGPYRLFLLLNFWYHRPHTVPAKSTFHGHLRLLPRATSARIRD